MARKTKARTKNAPPKKKPTATKGKSPARTAPKAGKRAPKRKGNTEVERRWADYLSQRTSLEQAVTAVRAAEEELSSAREIERARRKEFDTCKESLEQLLEVESATAARSQRKRPFDLQGPSSSPPGGPEGRRGTDEGRRGERQAEA